MKRSTRLLFVATGVLALTAMAMPQLKQLLKVVGVGAAVSQFGPDMNRAINRLTKHKDTPAMSTKVVPIIRVGIGAQSAIGAAQVSGPKRILDKVKAVAQPYTKLFNEIEVRALIPIASNKPDLKNLKPVQGVGVTGIVDLRL